MPSELERLLRQARETLPEPDPAVTRRAREIALDAGRRRPRRLPLKVGVALLGACALGVLLGATTVSSGRAAPAAVGFGFLPEPGWNVLQNGRLPTPARPALAIGANILLSPEDGADELPYATLLALPPRGVVIVVGSVGPRDEPDAVFPKRRLPLRLRDAAPQIDWGVQVRPARPLGQYQLRATVNGQTVDVQIYFGTEQPRPDVLAAAQRQLDRLVVGVGSPLERVVERAQPLRRPANTAAGAAAGSVIDRTFLCTPSYGRATVVSSPRGTPEVLGARFTSSGYGRVTSQGSNADPLSDLVAVAQPGFRNSSTRFPGSVYASARRCVASRAAVSLTRTGLPGPPVAYRTQADCTVRAKVLVRVRVILARSSTWRRLGGPGGVYNGAVPGPVVEAELAMRDSSTGRPLAMIKLTRTGQTQLWTSPPCL